ncbi:MAG: hypothetical protein Q8N26_10120 [Myxococcales bacterium]|nr:hypothetical protein [Myxococcales bacterium]
MSDERLHREVEVLRAELEALRSKVEAPRRRTRWLPLGVGIALVSTFAWAQLVTFSPDAPARADEVNGNFNQLRTWLEQKVGAVGSNTITTGGIAIGAAGPTQVTLGGNGSGQLTVTGGLALAEGTGIASNRLAAVTSVVNLNTNNFSSGFLEGTFADPGGTIVIMASATGWCSTAGRIGMQVRVDGVLQGTMRVLCNATGNHMAFPAAFLRLNRSLLTASGPTVSRTVRLEPLNCSSGCTSGLVTTNADINDFGEVTVLRLPTPF